jgi:hypothetical protein
LPHVHRALLLCLGLAACATGAESGTAPPDVDSSVTEGDASTDGSGDGSATQDTGSGVHDTGANDTGLSDSTAAGDTGGAQDALSDVVANDAPASDSGCAGHGTTGTLVTYVLTSESGSEASAPATTSTTGVTGGLLTRSSTLTAASGAGSINSSSWGTGATFSATKYYTFTVTPAAGCSVSLTKLALDVKASATGPTKGDVATSADAFGTHTAAFTGTSTPAVTLTASGTGAIEVRIYGYAASASGGTFRIQNTITLSGTIN